MNLQDVRTWFAYNRWANERLLEAAGGLSPDELERDLRGSFGSIRGTLRHLLWGERGWLHYWKAGSFTPDLSPSDLPDLASIRTSWASLEDEKAAFLRELTDEKLRAEVRVDENAYVLGELVQHILNHSTHHRGQVVHMLRELGRTPPQTGFRQFVAQNRAELA
ncbi:MAG TPA: DinB family protein [Thermoanaerobaculia bacterium]|jgi:uncharacterized damage-inducible protein DinB